MVGCGIIITYGRSLELMRAKLKLPEGDSSFPPFFTAGLAYSRVHSSYKHPCKQFLGPNMLDYDNSAFYYFAITCLGLYLIPGTLFFLKGIYQAFRGTSNEYPARTKEETLKRKNLEASNSGLQRLKKQGFLTNFICLALAWLLLYYLISLVSDDGIVSTFDPFQILKIEIGADDKAIKKAYRKLSLLYHPDKNIGNKKAEEMFMKIAKAYEALTDETSKANYEKYGNPDGRQAMELSIGLPKFILDNPKVVLVAYLLGMVGIVIAVAVWSTNSKKVSDKNIAFDTLEAFYYHLISKQATDIATNKRQNIKQDVYNLSMRQLPEILCCSAEFRAINAITRPEDKECMSKLLGVLQNKKLLEPKHNMYLDNAAIKQGNILLHAHLHRMTSELTPKLKQDLNAMLKLAPELIEIMIEYANVHRLLGLTLMCIQFSQCIKQGLFHDADPLLQLSGLHEEALKDIAKNSTSKNAGLKDFLSSPNEDKAGLDKLAENEKSEVLKACAAIPSRKCSVDLYVLENDEEYVENGKTIKISGKDIYENDIVKARITITSSNMLAPKDEENSSVYAFAPRHPEFFRENFWIILTSKITKGQERFAQMFSIEKVAADHRILDKGDHPNYTTQHTIQFQAPPKDMKGHSMQLLIFSDSYMGLHERLSVTFDVKSAKDLPKFQAHRDDLELANQPTLFELMTPSQDAGDSSDDDEPEPEDSSK
jgi:translocation protein SEC63